MSRHAAFVLAATLAMSGPAGAQVTGLVDPTEPFHAPQVGAGSAAGPRPLRLDATLVSAARRVAVINGTVVRIGDRLEGAVVTSIEGDGVELRRGNESFKLRIAREGVNANIRRGEPVK